MIRAATRGTRRHRPISGLRRAFRRRTVLVDADAWQRMIELAAIGEAIEIVEAAELRWLDLR